MKILSTLCIFLLLSCSKSDKKTDSTSEDLHPHNLTFKFTSIDNIQSLVRLFTNGKIKGDQIVWPMDYQDYNFFRYAVSSDSLCHTTIDTILVHDSIHYVFFRTDYYVDNEPSACHMCTPITSIASFYKTKDGYELKYFKKRVYELGGYGYSGSIKIDTLCVPVFHVSSGWLGSGFEIDYEHYFDLNNFSLLFNYTSYHSNEPDFEENAPGYQLTKKEIINTTDSSFVIQTTKIVVDSISGRKQTQHKELVTFYNEYGGIDLNTMKLEK
jgi:hypothetical protein